MKIKFESNNILPVDKDVNICIATIIIRAIFAQDGKYYPSYGPYLCDDCNKWWKNLMILKILLLFIFKKAYTEFIFCI